MSEPFHQILINPDNIPASIHPHYPGEVLIDHHWHRELELIASLDSQIAISVGNHNYVLPENDVALINTSEIHRGIPLPGKANSALSINFSPSFLSRYCDQPSNVYFDITNKPDLRKQIAGYMNEIFKIYDSDTPDPYSPLEVNSLLCRIAYLLLSQCQVINHQNPSGPSSKYRERYLEIMAYIQDHYNEPLSLEDIAEHAGLSKEHLSREFKKYVGEGFKTHLSTIRLSRAQTDLLNTDLPLLDIALKHGFPDLRSYTSVFTKTFGESPKQYRQEYKRIRRLSE